MERHQEGKLLSNSDLKCCGFPALTLFDTFLVSRFTPLSVCVPVRVRWGTEGVSSVRDHASSITKTTVWHELSETSLVRDLVFCDFFMWTRFKHDDIHFWSVFMNPVISVEVLTLNIYHIKFVDLNDCIIINHEVSFHRHHTAVREQTRLVETCSRWTHWTLLHLDWGSIPQIGWTLWHLAQSLLP